MNKKFKKILGRIDILVILKLLIQDQIIIVKVIFIHSVKFIIIYKVYTKYIIKLCNYILHVHAHASYTNTHTHTRIKSQSSRTKGQD